MLFPLSATHVEHPSPPRERGPVLFKLRQYGYQALPSEPWLVVHCPSSDRAAAPWPADIVRTPVREMDGIHLALNLFLRLCAETPLGITAIALGERKAVQSAYPEAVHALFADPSIFISGAQIDIFRTQLSAMMPAVDMRHERDRWGDLYWEIFYAARAFMAFDGNTLDRAKLARDVRTWVDPLYRDKMFYAWPKDERSLVEAIDWYGEPQYEAITRLFRDILFLNPIEFT